VSLEAPKDTDLDGLPDTWEEAHGLRKTYRLDAKTINPATGYSYLEEYLNSLVEPIIQAQNQDALFSTAIEETASTEKGAIQICHDNGIHIYSIQGIQEINLFNLAGQLIFQTSPHASSYSIPQYVRLNKGAYILTVKNNLNQEKSFKLII
jgi:hypothetical protein